MRGRTGVCHECSFFLCHNHLESYFFSYLAFGKISGVTLSGARAHLLLFRGTHCFSALFLPFAAHRAQLHSKGHRHHKSQIRKGREVCVTRYSRHDCSDYHWTCLIMLHLSGMESPGRFQITQSPNEGKFSEPMSVLFPVNFPSNLERSVQGAVSVAPEVFLSLYSHLIAGKKNILLTSFIYFLLSSPNN